MNETSAASTALPDGFASDFREAIDACRDDNWRRGFEILTRLAGEAGPKAVLPALFYSYLGVAVARCEGRRHDGMELVRYAIKLQPREPDNHCNRTLLCLMLGRRAEAYRSMQTGLRLHPSHRRLLEVERQMGIRRRPPLRFLSRSNPLNILLGQVTFAVRDWQRRRREEREEQAELLGS